MQSVTSKPSVQHMPLPAVSPYPFLISSSPSFTHLRDMLVPDTAGLKLWVPPACNKPHWLSLWHPPSPSVHTPFLSGCSGWFTPILASWQNLALPAPSYTDFRR